MVDNITSHNKMNLSSAKLQREMADNVASHDKINCCSVKP